MMFEPSASLTILSKESVINIPFNEITHVSRYGNMVFIYSIGRSRCITDHTMDEIVKLLPTSVFFRIHGSHIIALDKMHGVQRSRIGVGEDYLPVARKYKLRLLNTLKVKLNNGYSYCFTMPVQADG